METRAGERGESGLDSLCAASMRTHRMLMYACMHASQTSHPLPHTRTRTIARTYTHPCRPSVAARPPGRAMPRGRRPPACCCSSCMMRAWWTRSLKTCRSASDAWCSILDKKALKQPAPRDVDCRHVLLHILPRPACAPMFPPMFLFFPMFHPIFLCSYCFLCSLADAPAAPGPPARPGRHARGPGH